jgi:hypothetical protein
MISNSPNRRLGIVCSLAVIACLALVNGWQYLRYQSLEAKHRAVLHNAEQLKKTVNQLYAALKRTHVDGEFQVSVANTTPSTDADNAEKPRDLHDENPAPN